MLKYSASGDKLTVTCFVDTDSYMFCKTDSYMSSFDKNCKSRSVDSYMSDFCKTDSDMSDFCKTDN